MNLLLLIFDDLRSDFGMRSMPEWLLPNIRRLQSRGVTFSNTYTPCAICTPGRACLFSGMSPETTGVTTLSSPLRGRLPDLVTWPQALRTRGWHTMRSGKVFHKGIPDGICTRGNGADDPLAWCEKSNPGGYELNANGVMRNYTPWETHVAGIGGAIAWLRAEKGDPIHHDWHVASDVCESIRKRESEKPHFWAAGFARPHVPLVAPKRFFEAVDELDIPITREAETATPLPDHVRGQWCGDFGLSQEERTEAIRAYLACMAFADEQVGRILDQLDDSGQADETLVILTADHGFQLGEHGLWFKNFPYRESTGIPLIIADPRRPSSHGKTSKALVDQSDIFPTVFNLLGEAMPNQTCDGRSASHLLDKPDTAHREAILGRIDWGDIQGYSVRTQDHLYVKWEGASQDELYRLEVDEREEINLLHGGASDPAALQLSELI